MSNSWHIPLFDLWYDEAEATAVAEVLASRWLTMGPKVALFEEEFSRQTLDSRAQCVAVANCTCALELATRFAVENQCRRSGFGPPVFLVPDITFVATANAALAAGGEVDFVDIISPRQPVMSPEHLAHKIRQYGPRIAAVMPVHYAGFDAYTPISQLVHEHNLFVIEDVAHAPGACYAGTDVPLGTRCNLACFSFFSNKNLSTGEGGMVASTDPEMVARAKLLRAHGMTSTTFDRHTGRLGAYDVVEYGGHNYRCTEMTAALGLAQLSKLASGNARRREIYASYVAALNGVAGLSVCFAEDASQIRQTSACHILPLLCATPQQKDAIVRHLAQQRIQTSHHYIPVSQLSAWRALVPDALCPVSIDYSTREITLSLYPQMTDAMVDEVCAAVLHAAVPDTVAANQY